MNDSPFDLVPLVSPLVQAGETVAAGISGGPDSMALCYALGQAGIKVHALTVDHGLRAEAAEEARQVGAWLADMSGVTHHILTRALDEKPESKIQEDARHDRYALMAEYCAQHDIKKLFVAHHQDDQAETFLFRLAKGSGLDGLAAMAQIHDYNDALQIIRPFLDVPKQALTDYCETHGVQYVQDPSNDDGRYARVRLRQSYDVLAEEGLTPKRLNVTAGRMARARRALEQYTDEAFESALSEQGADMIVLDKTVLEKHPDEIRLRVLAKAIDMLGGDRDYGPRMEKMEDLAVRLFDDPAYKRASLGGCLVGLDRKTGRIIIETEKNRAT